MSRRRTALSITIGVLGGRLGLAQVTEQVLTPPPTGDEFGHSVVIRGEWAAVGSRFDSAVGVQGGAVYIYRLVGGAWAHHQTLFSPTPDLVDAFGTDVDMSDTYLIVGEPFDDGGVSAAGGAHLYRRVDIGGVPTWVLSHSFFASDGQGGDQFGRSVGVDEPYVIVGAPGATAASTGQQIGAAYIYELSGTWIQDAKIFPLGGADADECGTDVDISGGVAVIGGPLHSNQNGGAWVYKLDPNNRWVFAQQLLFPGAPGDVAWFGDAVCIEGDLLAIGAQHDDSFASAGGSVYPYHLSSGSWVGEPALAGSQIDGDSRFGRDVQIRGNALVAGAVFEDAPASRGAAYLFRRSGGAWTESIRLTASVGEVGDWFGQSVSIDAGYVLVGQSDGSTSGQTGEAYMFRLCPADLAPPFGQLDFSDVVAFLGAFGAMAPEADLAPPFGSFDFSDVVAFLSSFGGGCP